MVRVVVYDDYTLMLIYFVDVRYDPKKGLAMALTRSYVYCGSAVTITDEEENSLQAHGVNLITLRVSCSSCDNRKIQPMQSEDG